VTSPAKRKGDTAEREVCTLLNDHLGVPARRAFGAGRTLDEGDIVGVPRTSIQVCARADLDRAVREKLPELERQRLNARADFAALFVRRRGGSYVVVMTPEQWFALWREAA
jgi:Holliday junction resolvase